MKLNAIKLEFGFGVGLDANQNRLTVEERRTGLDWIKKVSVNLFGGYTLTETQGGWRNPAGIVVEEPGFTLTVYTTPAQHGLPTRIDILIDTIKAALHQEAVCITQSLVNSEIR